MPLTLAETIRSRHTSPAFVPDTAFIERAVDSANLNVLRMALYQHTRDPKLAAVRTEKRSARGGALTGYAIVKEDRAEIRRHALEYLQSAERKVVLSPTRAEARQMMDMFIGRKMTDSEVDYGYEQLCFGEYSRDVKWTSTAPRNALADFQVIIIGAGLSALAMAIQLDRLGISYKIFDRQKGLGGTWYLNDYPEARVDISSFLYQYKFVKNYPWQSNFATRDELREYMEYVAETYDVARHIRLETELKDARWDESAQRWQLNLVGPDGKTIRERANVIVNCCGLFSTPNLPDIAGIDDFKGKMFHTTAWDHDFDLTGKSVALIGTGSTGCQLARGVAKRAGHFSIFQRTPSWITPVRGYRDRISPEMRWLFDTLPGYWNWYNYSAYIMEMPMMDLQVNDPAWIATGGVVNERNHKFRLALTDYIKSKFPGQPDLAEKCTPSYPPLARRLVIDNDFYDTINLENVELVSDGIERFTETGIRTVDGEERDFDLVILSAGFKVSKYLWPIDYTGRNGVTPQDLWEKDGARAHLGMTMPGFPNFFICYGPNGQARAGGFHDWADNWSRYVGQILVHMIENDHGSFEVRRETFEDYNNRMDKREEGLLWESDGTGGYYVNEFGRSGVNMPWTVHEFYDMIRSADVDDFIWN